VYRGGARGSSFSIFFFSVGAARGREGTTQNKGVSPGLSRAPDSPSSFPPLLHQNFQAEGKKKKKRKEELGIRILIFFFSPPPTFLVSGPGIRTSRRWGGGGGGGFFLFFSFPFAIGGLLGDWVARKGK